jgi:hypothetical protein
MAMAARQKGRTPPPPTVTENSAPTLEVNVDWGEMLFGDLLLFQRLDENAKMTPEVIEALDRVVVGGIRHYKVKEASAIMDAIARASKDRGDAGN